MDDTPWSKSAIVLVGHAAPLLLLFVADADVAGVVAPDAAAWVGVDAVADDAAGVVIVVAAAARVDVAVDGVIADAADIYDATVAVADAAAG